MESVLFLLISLVVTSFCFAAANYVGWKLFDRPQHSLLWAAAFALAGCQYLVNLLRDFLPNLQTYWILANMIAFTVVTLVVWGHRVRLGLSVDRRIVAAAVLSLSIISVLATTVFDSQGIRVALAPGYTCVCMIYVAVLLLRSKRIPLLVQRTAAVVHLLFGLNQGAAALIGLRLGPEAEAPLISLYHMVNFALMPAFFVALGISVLMLVATDLAYKLKVLAVTDQLTGIANRRGYMEHSDRLFAQARRAGKPLALIVCDIDHFKRINDRFGHALGDEALRQFSKVLVDSTRLEDAVGRIGGEEFAITLGGMDTIEASSVAARIHGALNTELVELGNATVRMTASFGVAELGQHEDMDGLLANADKALYQAKASGRNRLAVAQVADAQLTPSSV